MITYAGKIYNNELTNCATSNAFKARPLKQWRKQRAPVNSSQTITKTKGLQSVYGIPGGTNIVDKTCAGCVKEWGDVPVSHIQFLENDGGELPPPLTIPAIKPPDTCDCNTGCITGCNAEKHARMKNRYPSIVNSDPSKRKYYQSNSSYLRAKYKTYDQNNTNSNNGVNNKCCDHISYYKPNNKKFGVQGAVSSSLRIAQLKYGI